MKKRLFALAIGICVLSAQAGVSATVADPASTPAPQAWDCVADQSGLVGHWEVQIDGNFSEFVYSKDLYPGNQPTRVVLTHAELKPKGGTVVFSSDQVELVIHSDQRASGVCPVYGEGCSPARLQKISLPEVSPAISPEISKGLIRARWSCAPSPL